VKTHAPKSAARWHSRFNRFYPHPINIAGDHVRVRFLGAATPESGGSKGKEFWGPEAKAHLKEMLEGRSVKLYPDSRDLFEPDAFGRALAYVERDDGLDINADVIEGGWGRVHPDYKCSRQQKLLAIEMGARNAERGMWNPEARAVWDRHHTLPDVAPEDATLIASKSRILHALGHCGGAPDKGGLFVDLEQAAYHGYTKKHSCLNYPHVAREDAKLVASKTSKLLHKVDCPRAPEKGVYFVDLEQAEEYGFVKRHSCVEE
ncbi:thermonuclease family protein, partial [Planctomycetota bacterium]